MPGSQLNQLKPNFSHYLNSPSLPPPPPSPSFHPGQDRGVTVPAQMCRLSLLPSIFLSLKKDTGKAKLTNDELAGTVSAFIHVVKGKGSYIKMLTLLLT